ncbi:MAG: hypothetical protein ACK5MJ_02275 [Alphaproteobacteria bacterium]
MSKNILYAIIIYLLSFSIAYAEVDIKSYFEEGRDFNQKPLTMGDIENFYEIWLTEQQDNIGELGLQSIYPKDGMFKLSLQRLSDGEIFHHQIDPKEPQTLINTVVLNEELSEYKGDLAIFSGRDFAENPLTSDDVQGFYEYTSQDKYIMIRDIKDLGDYLEITLINKQNKDSVAIKRVDKFDPKSLLIAPLKVISEKLIKVYPSFATRNFDLWPLTAKEVDDFYRKYRSLARLNIKGNYVRSRYSEKDQMIYAAFKGALSGKMIYHRINPKNPNSLLR